MLRYLIKIISKRALTHAKLKLNKFENIKWDWMSDVLNSGYSGGRKQLLL